MQNKYNVIAVDAGHACSDFILQVRWPRD